MTVKDLIYAEIDQVGEENLDELYEVVKQFARTKAIGEKSGVLSRLKQIKIQAPADFAANLDQYLNGEQPLAD